MVISSSLTISRVDLPLGAGAEMIVFLKNPVCSDIPHLGIPAVKILLHAERGLLGFIFSIAHATEFGGRFFDRPATMSTCVTLLTLSQTSLELDFRLYILSVHGTFQLRVTYLSSGIRRPHPS